MLALAGTWAVLDSIVQWLRGGSEVDGFGLLSVPVAAYGLYLFGFVALKGRLPGSLAKAEKTLRNPPRE